MILCHPILIWGKLDKKQNFFPTLSVWTHSICQVSFSTELNETEKRLEKLLEDKCIFLKNTASKQVFSKKINNE